MKCSCKKIIEPSPIKPLVNYQFVGNAGTRVTCCIQLISKSRKWRIPHDKSPDFFNKSTASQTIKKSGRIKLNETQISASAMCILLHLHLNNKAKQQSKIGQFRTIGQNRTIGKSKR